jgi:hypothetical protein
MEGPQALELLAACLAAGLPASGQWTAHGHLASPKSRRLLIRQPASTACAAVVRAFDGPVADDLGRVLAMLQLGVGEVAACRALRDLTT